MYDSIKGPSKSEATVRQALSRLTVGHRLYPELAGQVDKWCVGGKGSEREVTFQDHMEGHCEQRRDQSSELGFNHWAAPASGSHTQELVLPAWHWWLVLYAGPWSSFQQAVGELGSLESVPVS